MSISIGLEKDGAPSGNVFRRGLEYELFSTELSRPPRRCSASSERATGTKQEPEIVPAAVVVNLVEAHIVREERDDECDWRHHPVPQTEPEAGDAPVRGSDVRGGVGTGGTTRQEQSTQEQQTEQVRFLHRLFSFKVQCSLRRNYRRDYRFCRFPIMLQIYLIIGLESNPNKNQCFGCFNGLNLTDFMK